VAVTFRPKLQSGFLVLHGFTVQDVRTFDYRIFVPVVAVPVGLLVVWLYTRRKKKGKGS